MDNFLRILMMLTLLLQSICIFTMTFSVYKSRKRDEEFYEQLDEINKQMLEDLKCQPTVMLKNTEEEIESEQEDPNKK